MSYDREPIEATVAELKPRMKAVTILFKVIEIREESEVTSRRDGTTHRVADVVIGDSTGIIIMPLWDNAIDTVEVDQIYEVTNGYTGFFRGHLRLNVGRYGKLSDSKEEIEEINMDLDMSAEEYEDTRYRKNYDNRSHDTRDRGYGGRGGGDRGYGGRDRRR